jgi:AraC-like DNA-binding protein
MTQYIFSNAISPSSTPSVALGKIYQIKADHSYDVTLSLIYPNAYVAIRTFQGEGALYLNDSQCRLGAQSLFLTPWKKIRRYHCQGNLWEFWWFRFTFIGKFPLPISQLLHIPKAKEELSDFKRCFDLLRKPSTESQALASAHFNLLLHQWAIKHPSTTLPKNRYHEVIYQVIETMNNRLSTPLSVSDMAQEACLSERHFHQIFAQVTGKPPKQFYNELRLNMGAEYLCFNVLTISQIADKLGYSSPFHFSKAFRKHFGVPPSHYLKRMITVPSFPLKEKNVYKG